MNTSCRKRSIIAALQGNRLFARSEKDKKEVRFVRVDTLQLTDQQAARGWLKGFGKEALLILNHFALRAKLYVKGTQQAYRVHQARQAA